MWPELGKAKKALNEIEQEIDELLKRQNALTKKEIAFHKENLLSEFDESSLLIKEKLEEFRANLEAHRKQLRSRSDFLKRHNYSIVRNNRKH